MKSGSSQRRVAILALAVALAEAAAPRRKSRRRSLLPWRTSSPRPRRTIASRSSSRRCTSERFLPLERNDICPGESLCVLGGGGDVGIEIERRWPFGLGVLVGYDAWFVEAGGVFELGVVHVVRAGLQWVFADELWIHPAIHIGGGALVFGDTLLVSTVGGAVEAGASAELELTQSVALTLGAQVWAFTTTPFTTSRDRTPRSEGGLGLNVALQLNVGLSILAESSVH